MKYTNEVTMSRPLEKVIELFDNPANMSKWQPGFISMEHQSGTPGTYKKQSQQFHDLSQAFSEKEG